MKLRKIHLSNHDSSLIREISGIKLSLRNSFDNNKPVIKSLMDQGRQNALIYLQRQQLGQQLSLLEENNIFLAVVSLQKRLKLKVVPRRIECYDISHLQGKFCVGSMITFIDGRATKKYYKLFRCPNQNDDFLNHKLVLSRRLQKYLDNQAKYEWQLPNLIIVDGGKGQLSGNYEILKNFNLDKQIEIISIAKKEEEIFLIDSLHSIVSQVSDLGKQGGILLKSPEKEMVQRIRDEAHRFAITNNRNTRLKEAKKSKLDTIPGVGIITKQKILTNFKSYQNFVEILSNNKEIVYEILGLNTTNKIIKYLNLN
jgi:excinuclease ABC subunit C